MRSRNKRYTPSIVREREHIPADYVAIGPLHDSDPTLHRSLNRAAEVGRVKSFRLGDAGPWFIWNQHLDAEKRRRAESPRRRSSRTQRAESESGDSGPLLVAVTAFLGAITTNQATLIAAVERLAFAAEKIAEHPLARMDDIAICEPSESANGFHS